MSRFYRLAFLFFAGAFVLAYLLTVLFSTLQVLLILEPMLKGAVSAFFPSILRVSILMALVYSLVQTLSVALLMQKALRNGKKFYTRYILQYLAVFYITLALITIGFSLLMGQFTLLVIYQFGLPLLGLFFWIVLIASWFLIYIYIASKINRDPGNPLDSLLQQ